MDSLKRRIMSFLFDDTKRTKPISILLIFLMTFLASIAQTIFKFSSSMGNSLFSFFLDPYFYIGVIIYVFCYLLYMAALKYGELSVLMPFLILTFVFSLLSANWFLGEAITLVKLASLGMILIGLFFLGLSVHKDTKVVS